MSTQNLLLLHGALGSSAQFAPIVPLLEDHFDLHTLDLEGHGHSPIPSHPFSMQSFAQNVFHYLTAQGIRETHIFGYSMGGYIACTLALSHPHLVQSIATLGTKYLWSPEVALREVGYLDPNKIEAKVPAFAQALAARHIASGWRNVLHHTADLLTSLGPTGGLTPAVLANLQTPIRVMVGDRDTTVSVAEAAEIYKALPNGELEILPNTPHQLEKVSVEKLAHSLIDYFSVGE